MVRVPYRLLALSLVLGGATQVASAQTCGLTPSQQAFIVREIATPMVTIFGLPGTTQVLGACATTPNNTTVALPFTFNYFGSAKTSLRINRNGFVIFDLAFNGIGNTNTGVPVTGAPNDFIAPFWDNLIPAPGTGAVLHRTDGPVGNRVFTVEWRDAMPITQFVACTDNGARLNFQVRLFEADNSIQLLYGGFAPITIGTGTISATVGLENAAGSIGLDLTGLNTGNAAPPSTNFRLYPGASSSVLVTYAATLAPASTFASIAGVPGATQVFFPSTGAACDDDGAVALPISFPFSFYNVPRTTVEMSMNGLATFDFSLGAPGVGNPNAPIPAPGIPNDYAAAWYDDLLASDVAPLTGGWWLISGPPGNEVLTMEWTNLSIWVSACVDSGDRLNVQLQFQEAGNLVVCKYGAQVVGTGPNDATIGVENNNGTVGTDGTGLGTLNATFPTGDITFAQCNATGLVVPFGNGCPGNLVTPPTLGTAGGAPVTGNGAFAITMSGGPATGPAALILGGSGSNWLVFDLPMGLGIFGFPGCSLFASPDLTVSTLTTGAGTASIPAGIPAIPTLIGGSAWVEWVTFTPALATTGGAQVIIG